MTGVVLDAHGGVIEHDEIVYHDKPEPEPTPKPEPEKECCGKHYTIVLHLH